MALQLINGIINGYINLDDDVPEPLSRVDVILFRTPRQGDLRNYTLYNGIVGDSGIGDFILLNNARYQFVTDGEQGEVRNATGNLNFTRQVYEINWRYNDTPMTLTEPAATTELRPAPTTPIKVIEPLLHPSPSGVENFGGKRTKRRKKKRKSRRKN
jgi:hypothetical protein